MKKIFLNLFLAAMLAFPVAVLGANQNLSDNPYSINDPTRNFYNNLNDRQKFLVRFSDNFNKNLDKAQKSANAFGTSAASGKDIEESALAAAQVQLASAEAIYTISVQGAPLSAEEIASLENAKKIAAQGLLARAAGEIAFTKSRGQLMEDNNDALSGAADKIDDILKQNQLGFDAGGYLVKYDKTGNIIEYQMPETYTKQKGDVYLPVPFFAQAPGGGWYDTCQGAACEETALIQAHMWIDGVDYSDHYKIYSNSDMLQRYGLRQILALCDYQYDNLASHLYHDTSISDTAELWQNFYGLSSKIIENPAANRLKRGIDAGHTYVIPINGQKILTSLPYSDPAKLPAHSILLVGYNDERGEFIVNDPGTWRGQGWRFNQNDLMAAIRDYPSGNEEQITKEEKRVLELPVR